LRQKDFAHAAGAQLLQDSVMRDLLDQVGLPRDGERIHDGAIHTGGLFENIRVNLIPLPTPPNDELFYPEARSMSTNVWQASP
jgi:hypothetical protein